MSKINEIVVTNDFRDPHEASVSVVDAVVRINVADMATAVRLSEALKEVDLGVRVQLEVFFTGEQS